MNDDNVSQTTVPLILISTVVVNCFQLQRTEEVDQLIAQGIQVYLENLRNSSSHSDLGMGEVVFELIGSCALGESVAKKQCNKECLKTVLD